MKRKTQEKKGITLISLVITIIVLLILAVVAINLAVNSEGLFEKTGTAANNWNTSVVDEQTELNNLFDVLEPKITAASVSQNLSEYFGKEVYGYSCANNEGVHAWKIFYADEDNIYLIADENISSSYVPAGRNGSTVTLGSRLNTYGFDDVLNDYDGATDIQNSKAAKWLSFLNVNSTSEEKQVKATAYLMDDTIWANFAGQYADYAIGAPTIDMFIAAYNEVAEDNKLEYSVSTTGYSYKNVEGAEYKIYYNNEFMRKFSYTEIWLAGGTRSDSLANYRCSAEGVSGYYDCWSFLGKDVSGYLSNLAGIRPIVCLNKDVKLEEYEGAYKIAGTDVEPETNPDLPETNPDLPETDPNLSEYFGKEVVNYTCSNDAGVHAWKIFYADENNIYLIADEGIGSSYVPAGKHHSTILISANSKTYGFDDVLNDYTGAVDILNSKAKKWLSFLNYNRTSQEDSVKATAYLMDDTIWANFAGQYADYAIGAPTIDMFVKAYNAISDENQIECSVTADGYSALNIVGGTTKLNEKFSDCIGTSQMWLAGNRGGYSVGRVLGYYYCNVASWYAENDPDKITKGGDYLNALGTLRPIVCLNKDVKLEAYEGAYKIVEAE